MADLIPAQNFIQKALLRKFSTKAVDLYIKLRKVAYIACGKTVS